MKTDTIGAQLERSRLRHREQRIQQVLDALQDRAVYRHETEGGAPGPLRHAIADFAVELGEVRSRLAQIAPA
jgi:hypothetical protein